MAAGRLKSSDGNKKHWDKWYQTRGYTRETKHLLRKEHRKAYRIKKLLAETWEDRVKKNEKKRARYSSDPQYKMSFVLRARIHNLLASV
jgi:hypothetical protein